MFNGQIVEVYVITLFTSFKFEYAEDVELYITVSSSSQVASLAFISLFNYVRFKS